MAEVIDKVEGKIVNYDERRGVIVIEAPYTDFATMCRREYKTVEVTLLDSRPLSAKQRRCCYAMIGEIARWSGYDKDEAKEGMKFHFIESELMNQMDYFSLSNAKMSLVAAFQRFLARFIVKNDVPTKVSMLEYVSDIPDYTYQCLIHKKCVICGKRADLHHVTAIGAGRDRDKIDHLGMEVLPLCREHHNEIHSRGKDSFFKLYHLECGIEVDKTIAKIYSLHIDKKKAG